MLKPNTQTAIRSLLNFARTMIKGSDEIDEAIADFDQAYPIPTVDFDAAPPVCALEISNLSRNETCGRCGHAAHLHKNWPHHNPQHPNYRPESNR